MRRIVVRRFAVLLILCALALPVAAARAWTWPVDGPVLTPFSFDRAHPYAGGQHRGVDLGAPAGAKVVAPAGGVVSFAGTVPTGGKTVSIQTPSGYTATLVHLGSIGVARGATVAEGSAVGTVGPSGTVYLSEPYVYFGVRVTSDQQGYVDPLTLLPARPPAPASLAPESEPVAEAPAAAPAGTVPAAAAPAVVDTPMPTAAVSKASTGSVVDTAQAPAVDTPVSSERPATAVSPVPASASSAAVETAAAATEAQATPGADAAAIESPNGRADAVAAPLSSRLRAPGGERQSVDDARTAPARHSPRSAQARRIPWLFMPVALALLFSLAVLVRRAVGRKAARIMCVPEPEPSFVGAEANAQDPGGARLALCVGEASSGPRGRVRSPGRHLRALPPVEGQRRADGEWHGRTRHAGDGHGGPRRRLAA